jgi:hypothetical protein
MNDTRREAIQRSNHERNLRCGKCGAMGLTELDDSRIGGMTGLKYKFCNACGWSRAITKRPGKVKLNV